MNNSNKNKITVGIDIGTETTKVVLGPSLSCEIVRNDTGGHTTTTAVSFASQNGLRQIGETASLKGTNSVIHLNRLIRGQMVPQDNHNGDPFGKFYMFKHSQQVVEDNNDNSTQKQVTVDYGGTDRTFSPPALLAMLLGDVKKNVLATIQRLSNSDDNDSNNNSNGTTTDESSSLSIEYLLSVPFGASPQAKDDLMDAAYAAGMGATKVVESCHCYGAAYQRKFPENLDGRTVLVVDMGHSQTQVSVLKMGQEEDTVSTLEVQAAGDGDDENNKDKDKKMEVNDNNEDFSLSPKFIVLGSNCHKSLGAGSVDIRLWHHFQSTVPALNQVTPNSRAGQRLLDGVNKLKTLLSQLPEGSVTVENVGANDSDLKLTATRDMLAELCQPEALALTELIQSVMDQAGVCGGTVESSLTAVEVLGGGCRMPWVQQAILKSKYVVAANHVSSLSHSFDDTSAALGAALIGEEYTQPQYVLASGVVVSSVVPADAATTASALARRTQLLQEETAMATMDQDQHAKAYTRNQLESHVLEMRSAGRDNGKHGSLLPTNLDSYLDELDDWLFSDEAETATKDEMATKLEATIFKTKNELCPAYFAAIQQEQAAKEQEMEEEAKQAQLERDGGERQEGEEDDHDNRRLPKKRRMEIVMKNKTEANELFSDGNFKWAAARYTKALSHCAKFVDLNPDDIQEVNAVKLSLNLNLALAYCKLENYDQALRVCNDAIAIDPRSIKALYRRASVYYEKKRWGVAMTDVKNALEVAPENGAVLKLQDLIDWQIKKQKAKEKKMAQKMFR
jgi:molecular chaperone DnaK (HSP70)